MFKNKGMIVAIGPHMTIENQQPSSLTGKGSTTISQESTLITVETGALFNYSFYCLIDPNNGLPKYVGRTVNPSNRLRNHLYEARKFNKTKKQRWIFKLLTNRQVPILRVIHYRACSLEQAIIIEKRLVMWFSKHVELKNEPDHYLGTIGTGFPVYQYTLNGEFIAGYLNKHQASIITGINDGNINRACLTLKSAGGYQWRTIKTSFITTYSRNKSVKRVTNGHQIFNSAREASIITGVGYKQISACCRGKAKQAGGNQYLQWFSPLRDRPPVC